MASCKARSGWTPASVSSRRKNSIRIPSRFARCCPAAVSSRLPSGSVSIRPWSCICALTQPPDFLFADEPTGDLDDENTRLVLSALRDYAHEQKKAVFIVTHESDAMEYADRSFRMDGGQLIAEADPKGTA